MIAHEEFAVKILLAIVRVLTLWDALFVETGLQGSDTPNFTHLPICDWFPSCTGIVTSDVVQEGASSNAVARA
jgi:hypothetical protein